MSDKIKNKSNTISVRGETKIGALDFDYTWSIKNLSLTRHSQVDSPSISSPDCKISWRLSFKRIMEEKFDCLYRYDIVHVYLCPLRAEKVTGHCTLSILDADSGVYKTMPKYFSDFSYRKEKPYALDFFTGLEFDYLIDPANRIVRDDTLTIRCQLKILAGLVERTIEPLEPGFPVCDLIEDLESLRTSGSLCDVTLHADDREFRAHKIILAARSPVFKRMFSCNMKETLDGRVDVLDVEPNVVEAMLKFIYTGKLPSDGKEPDNKCSFFIGLLKAADKYQIDPLKATCENALLKTMSTKSVGDILTVANLHNSADLKNAAIKFIEGHAKEVIGHMAADGSLFNALKS